MAAGIVIRQAHFPGRPAIEAYGNGGFRFADMSHRGSILCLPSGVHGWEPDDPEALAERDFARLLDEAGEIEILLVGMGRDLKPLPKALRETLKAAGIAAEPMSTGAAVRTYNVLLAEDRAVAAALIAVD
ncbi:Mth938-like domain-containing protein [Mesorhizobium xinjiangense]|uniref:Mth938-like domain-containing protein n=1 Tax=Mesorhizobium xinjiangense TaxID=2678685 RepID=UPI0012ED2D63|nr:Mth938-like domain-containing protein [Mesorhizobium xinjiangense]